MQRYILGRIVQTIFGLLAVTIIVFLLVRLTGDPADIMLPEDATEEDYVRITAYLGLDKPLPVQYGIYMSNLLQGDFGQSIRSRRPVFEMVVERLPATLELAFAAALFAVLISLPIGVQAAVKRGSVLDQIARGFAILGQAMPTFWLGLVLILIFAVALDVLPIGGRGGLIYLILPAFSLGYYVAAGIMRLTRSSMIDVLGSEYIKLARIKGVAEGVVIWKHAFRNAALPVLTFASVIFVHFVGGSIITETVFSWPGVGRLVWTSVVWRDFPVVQAVVLLLCTLYLLGNLGVDVLYAYLDPKIRYQK